MSIKNLNKPQEKRLMLSEPRHNKKNPSILNCRHNTEFSPVSTSSTTSTFYPTITVNNKLTKTSLKKIVGQHPKILNSTKSKHFYKKNSFINSKKIISKNVEDSKKNDEVKVDTPIIIKNNFNEGNNKKCLQQNNNEFYITETCFNFKPSKKSIGGQIYSYRKNNNETEKKILSITNNDNTSDYTAVMKRLDKWDKEHCAKNSENVLTLFLKLDEYYTENKLYDDQKNLNATNIILKSKNNFNKIFETVNNKNLKAISNLLYNSKDNSLTRTNLYEDIQKKIINNPNSYITELSKSTIKYEKQSHKDLIFVNNIILDKKDIKVEKSKEYEKICEKQTELRLEYNEKYSDKMKLYWLKLDEYDHHYKKIIQTQELIEKNKEKEREKEKKNSNDRKNFREEGRRFSQILNDIEFAKKTKLYSISTEFKKDLNDIQNDYMSKYKVLENKKNKIENDLKINSYELLYYKMVNEELLREHRSYYLEILKKGKDFRKEGLIWVVRNLLELQVNLEYHQFPKYLNYEQIDYLKNLGKIMLEESELKIIIKVLQQKKKHERFNENMKCLNMLDGIMNKDNQEDKMLLYSYTNNLGFMNNDRYNKEKDIYDEDYINAKHIIDKKFIKIYKNNEEILNNYLGKNSEELKLHNISEKIRKGIYTNSNENERNIIRSKSRNNRRPSVLEAFMMKTENKDIFNVILDIKNRLFELQKIKESMYDAIKENYLAQIKFLEIPTGDNGKIKDNIKKALFGTKTEF